MYIKHLAQLMRLGFLHSEIRVTGGVSTF
jgi:hypothetical protein